MILSAPTISIFYDEKVLKENISLDMKKPEFTKEKTIKIGTKFGNGILFTYADIPSPDSPVFDDAHAYAVCNLVKDFAKHGHCDFYIIFMDD